MTTTKREYYQEILNVLGTVDADATLVDFVNKQIEAIDAKAAKAKERAAKKAETGDELKNVLKTLLTAEYQTADELCVQLRGAMVDTLMDEGTSKEDATAKVDAMNITKAKVVSRCTMLVKAGIAVKEPVKTEDGRKVMGYKVEVK